MTDPIWPEIHYTKNGQPTVKLRVPPETDPFALLDRIETLLGVKASEEQRAKWARENLMLKAKKK